MLLEGEQLIEAVSTHWMKYARPLAIMIFLLPVSITLVITPGIFFDQFQLGAYTPFFLGLLLLSTVIHWGFHRLLNESMVDVIITNRRVIYLHSSPLFKDVIREFHMERIRAVEGRKAGIFQNIFGYGSLSVNTEGSGFRQAESIVKFMPRPNEYSQKIIAAMEQAGFSKIKRENKKGQLHQKQAAQRIYNRLRTMRKKLTGR